MKPFKDNVEREWCVEINVSTVRRVRDVLEVDLLDVFDGKMLEKLARDPVLLVDVVYVLCQPQAAEKSVTAEEFGRAMAGEAIDNATKALMGELVDFFPNAHVRDSLQTILHAQERIQSKGNDVLKANLTDEAIDALVAAAIKSLVSAGNSSGDAPGSSA